MASIDFGTVLRALSGGASGFREVSERRIIERERERRLAQELERALALRDADLDNQSTLDQERFNREQAVRSEEQMLDLLITAAQAGSPGLRKSDSFRGRTEEEQLALRAVNRGALKERRSDKKDKQEQIRSRIRDAVATGVDSSFLQEALDTSNLNTLREIESRALGEVGNINRSDREHRRRVDNALVGQRDRSNQPRQNEEIKAQLDILKEQRRSIESQLEGFTEFETLDPKNQQAIRTLRLQQAGVTQRISELLAGKEFEEEIQVRRTFDKDRLIATVRTARAQKPDRSAQETYEMLRLRDQVPRALAKEVVEQIFLTPIDDSI